MSDVTSQNPITSNRWAVMRHGQECGTTSNSSIERLSADTLTANMNILSGHVRGLALRKIKIYRSESGRAEATALICATALKKQGFKVEIEAMKELNVRKLSVASLLDPEVLDKTPDSFVLAIGHEPDIEAFLDLKDDIDYCSVFGMNFTIPGHQHVSL